MASIEKRGKKYRITVSNGYSVDGKKKREHLTYEPDEEFLSMSSKKKERKLELIAAEFEAKVLSGKVLSGEKMTLASFAEKWIKEYAYKNVDSATTLDSYKHEIETKIIPALGHIRLSKITPLHIQSLYNNLAEDGVRIDKKEGGYATATIKKVDAILSIMLSTAVLWQLIEKNPCDGVKIPKERMEESKEKIQCFTPEQAMIFLQVLDMGVKHEYGEHYRKNNSGKLCKIKAYTEEKKIPTQFKVFFNIALFGGLRKGEILALTWDDFDFEKNTVSVTKNTVYSNKKITTKAPKTVKSNRTIVLPVSVMDMVRMYRKEQLAYRISIGDQWKGEREYLFIQSDGTQMHPSTPYHTFKKIIHRYNEGAESGKELPDIKLHDLRHTSATLLIGNNIDVRTVSARLGHAQTSTTMNIYAHALEELDQKAAQSMENLFKNKA